MPRIPGRACGGDVVSHVGIAVADLDKAIERYCLMTGQDAPTIIEVDDQKVKVAMFSGSPAVKEAAGARVELLAATAPDSPIAAHIARRGEGLHHVCLYVDDIEQKLAELKAAGVKLIDETPRVGAEGNKIAFVHPSGMNSVLIELEQRTK